MNNLTNKSEVLKAIENLALQLFKEKSSYTRSDIAFELRKHGVVSDSATIDELVIEVYESSKGQGIKQIIKSVFLNNSLTRSIVENVDLKNSIKSGDLKNANNYLKNREQEVQKVLMHFSEQLETISLDTIELIKKKNVIGKITGTYKIEKVKNEAAVLFENYQNIVESYGEAKQSILSLIEDYSILRSEIIRLYRKNVIQLTDIFGPKIKAVEPQIFDYNSIEYLQTDKLLETIKLEFDNLMNSCGEVMDVLNNSFASDLSMTTNFIGRGSNRDMALAMAAFAIVKSQMNTSKQSTILRQSLERMRNNMDGDITAINADVFRLQLIHKTINEITLPIATVFQRKFDHLFTKDLKNLLVLVYQKPELKEFKNKKDQLLINYNDKMNHLNDHKNQIVNYENKLDSNRQQLEEYSQLFKEARSYQPKKPNSFRNVLTLGKVKKSYNRDIDEWHSKYQHVIQAYCNLQEVVKDDEEELNNHLSNCKKIEAELKELNKSIEENSNSIFVSINQDKELQMKLSEELVPIINLLRIGRKAAEFKIEDEHLAPLEIERMKVDILPEATRTRLDQLTNSFKEGIFKGFSEKGISNYADELEKINSNAVEEELEQGDTIAENTLTANNDEKSIREDCLATDEFQHMETAGLETVSIAIDIIKETAILKKMEIENRLSKEQYKSQLNLLKDRFKDKIATVNNRSLAISQIIQSINKDDENLQGEYLKELIEVEDDFWITEKELIKNIQSGKTIII